MMKIYTSYFGNWKRLNQAGIKMICVAVKRPHYFYGAQMLNVAPTYFMISKSCSHEKYLQMYDEILSHQRADDVLKQIEALSHGQDVALCCYEKPGEFCHRHLLAKWLTEGTGIEIKEYGYIESKAPKYEEGALF